jgi:hypothetical protein
MRALRTYPQWQPPVIAFFSVLLLLVILAVGYCKRKCLQICFKVCGIVVLYLARPQTRIGCLIYTHWLAFDPSGQATSAPIPS